MNQQFKITLKQRTDGQIRVSSIFIPKEVRLEEPFLKEQLRKEIESLLEENHIRVLKDVGFVDFD